MKKILRLMWGIIVSPAATLEKIKNETLFRESFLLFLIILIILSTISAVLQGFIQRIFPSVSTPGGFNSFILSLNTKFIIGLISVVFSALVIDAVLWTFTGKKNYRAILACVCALTCIVLVMSPLWFLLDIWRMILISSFNKTMFVKPNPSAIIYVCHWFLLIATFLLLASIQFIWGTVLGIIAIRKVYLISRWKSLLNYLISVFLLICYCAGIGMGLLLIEVLPGHPFSGTLQLVFGFLAILIGYIILLRISGKYYKIAWAVIICVITVISPVIFGIPIYNSQRAIDCNEKGIELRKKGKYEEALVAHRKAIKICPYEAIPHVSLGLTYKELGEVSKAFEEYTKALKLDKDTVEAYHARGLLYRKQKLYDMAVADFNKAIEIDPSYVLSRGSTYLDQHLYDKAIADYSKAIELDHKDERAYTNRGMLYKKIKLYDKAIADFNKAIEIDPNFISAQYSRGSTYSDQHLYDEAITNFSKVIELDPNYVLAYHARGNAYFNKRLYNKAIVDYSKAIKLDPNFAKAYRDRGNTYMMQGLFDKALADFDKAKKLDPNDSETYEKISDISKDIKLNPNDVKAYHTRGMHYESLKLYDKAIADYSKAIEIDPNFTRAYSFRARIYKNKLKLYDKAIADYSKVFELNPDKVYARVCRGNIYKNLKLYDKAIADYSEAVEIKPYHDICNKLALLLATCKEEKYRDGEKAVKYALKAVELRRKDHYYLDTLAAAYAEAGDFENAVETQNKAIGMAKNKHTLKRFKSRLNLYKKGIPYHKK